MNRKSMIIFILWCALCIGLIVFFVIHVIVHNANQSAQMELARNVLLDLRNLKL